MASRYGVTISAPHMHAYCLEFLEEKLRPNSVCLDVGSGTGIFTAYMSAVAEHKADVIGVDHIPDLVEMAKANVAKSHSPLLKLGRVQFFVADGRNGYPARAPYDW